MDISQEQINEAVKAAMHTPEPYQMAGAAVMVAVSIGTAIYNGITLYHGIKIKMAK